MSSFIGNKTNIVEESIQPDTFFPAIDLSKFQQAFSFQEDVAANTLIDTATQAIISINLKLASLKDNTSWSTFAEFGQSRFGNAAYAQPLYLRAVHSLIAADLLAYNTSLDATKEAAARNDNLLERQNYHLQQSREAIDKLLKCGGIRVELV